MEILQLKYFYETAKNESITKTAQKFMVSVPSVSATIKKLEQELGAPLFDRSSNRIVLNEKGRQFFKTANLILSELEKAAANINSQNDDNREINILARSNRVTLINKIIEFRQKRPQTSFNVELGFDDEDLDKYHIIIQEKSDFSSDYEGFILSQPAIKIVASADNPLCNRPITLKQLRGIPFVTIGENSDSFRIFKEACQREGFTPEIKIKCNDYQCYDKCIENDTGLSVQLSWNTSYIPPKMKYLDVTDFNEKFIIYVYYKKQDYYGNVKDFIDLLRK